MPIPTEFENNLSISRNDIAKRGYLEVNANEIDINKLLFGEGELEYCLHETGVVNASKAW
jgi:hypothetical protein